MGPHVQGRWRKPRAPESYAGSARKPVGVQAMRTTEYIVVADKTSQVLFSAEKWIEAVRYAAMIRRGGGEVTIFKSTKG